MRRTLAAALAVALLAGCGEDAEPPRLSAPESVTAAAAPLSYDYLNKLPLDVSQIVLNDTWSPQSTGGDHIETLADPSPEQALARMVRDRVVAAGGQGQGVVTIEEASLTRVSGQLVGSFSVRVALEGGAADAPPVLAAVSGTRTLTSDDSEQETANRLVRQLMERMNVELEFQMRRELKTHMTGGGAPSLSPSEVQTEDLGPVAPP